MSRSYKKPYISTTCIGDKAGMMKWWKKQCNKKVRSSECTNGAEYKKLVNQWQAPNDGKMRWDEPRARRK